jgi:hypothetical protein
MPGDDALGMTDSKCHIARIAHGLATPNSGPYRSSPFSVEVAKRIIRPAPHELRIGGHSPLLDYPAM